MRSVKLIILKCLLLSLFRGAVEGLRDVHISVPVAVKLGQPTTLYCEYELENDTLYSMKWYKAGREFFRSTPKEKPSIKVFPTNGITKENIALEQSNGTQVHFKKTTIAMSGRYCCEVSADSPSFRTSVVHAHLEVVDPPKGRPVLSGLKPKYRLGDIIHANCTSSGSRPAVNLSWVLNGKSAPRKHVKHFLDVTSTDLIRTTSTIKLHARVTHFPSGRLKLQCTASIPNLYWQMTEKSARLIKQNGGHDDNESDFGNNVDDLTGNRKDFNENSVFNPTEFDSDESRASLSPIDAYDDGLSPHGQANSIRKLTPLPLTIIILLNTS